MSENIQMQHEAMLVIVEGMGHIHRVLVSSRALLRCPLSGTGLIHPPNSNGPAATSIG